MGASRDTPWVCGAAVWLGSKQSVTAGAIIAIGAPIISQFPQLPQFPQFPQQAPPGTALQTAAAIQNFSPGKKALTQFDRCRGNASRGRSQPGVQEQKAAAERGGAE